MPAYLYWGFSDIAKNVRQKIALQRRSRDRIKNAQRRQNAINDKKFAAKRRY